MISIKININKFKKKYKIIKLIIVFIFWIKIIRIKKSNKEVLKEVK
jgi:hypothetical protein